MYRKIGISMIFLLLFAVLLVGCGDGNETSDFDGELKLTGSSTLAPTISTIADAFAEEYGTWDQVDESLPEEEISISVATGGSSAGAKAILDGTAHIGMMARNAKDEEMDAMENYQEVKIGIDALLMAVNQENGLGELKQDLTKEEIRRIFSGEQSLWSEVSGDLPEEEIVLLVRDVGGGAHGVFQDVIMEDEDVTEKAIEVPSMSGLVERLIGNEGAIGYASFGVAEQYRDDLVAFSIDGIEPSEENIISGDYPLSRPLNLVWDGEASTEMQVFIDYIESEAGREIIAEMGFLPME